jgi:hypothetical protein
VSFVDSWPISRVLRGFVAVFVAELRCHLPERRTAGRLS